jgi:hypothetical protein
LPRSIEDANLQTRPPLWATLAALLLCVPLFAVNRQHNPGVDDNKSRAPITVDEPLPQLVDITDSTGVKFDQLSNPEQKYIVESMSGGVALIDYDRDGGRYLLYKRPKRRYGGDGLFLLGNGRGRRRLQ